MSRIRTWGAIATVALAGVFAIVLSSHPVHAYQDSSATINRPGADIVDTYFFPSPSNANNVVAIMTVDPLIVPGKGAFFDQSVLYQMKFDNHVGETGHNIPVEDIVIQFSVGAVINNQQQILMYGPSPPNQTGTTNTLLTESGTGTFGKSFTSGQISVRTGVYAASSFYNRAQLLAILPDRNKGSTVQTCLPGGTNTCPDGFGGTASGPSVPSNNSQNDTNVLAIVVEMPRTELEALDGNMRVAYWATTATETGR
jgi:hypothetical protein